MPWPTVQQCPGCRKSAALTGPHNDIPDWDLEEVYRFLLRFYGSSSEAAEPGMRGLLKKRTKSASWTEATLVFIAVGAVVFMVLRGSSQYRLRKSESRVL